MCSKDNPMTTVQTFVSLSKHLYFSGLKMVDQDKIHILV